MTRCDSIEITGNPPAWQLNTIVGRLVWALRKGKWIPASSQVLLSVSCVDAIEMTALNARYRGKKKPTDILSFEQTHGRSPSGTVMLGDLVVCRELVREVGKELGHGARQEAAILIAHGLLHLLGYDHERSAKAAAEMGRAEEKLLRLAGFDTSTGLVDRAKVKR